MALWRKEKSVEDLVMAFIEFNETARSAEEYAEKLRKLLLTKTVCPECSTHFQFDDALQCNDADQSYEFFCPSCRIRFTGIRTRPLA